MKQWSSHQLYTASVTWSVTYRFPLIHKYWYKKFHQFLKTTSCQSLRGIISEKLRKRTNELGPLIADLFYLIETCLHLD